MSEKICDKIYWIGVNNPEGRDFHGVSTPRGGSYNSYLVKGFKNVLIDLCNVPFFDKFILSLKEVVDLKKIDYVIINHAEPDHVGAIEKIMKLLKNAKIICTKKCKEFLLDCYDLDCEFELSEEFKLDKFSFHIFPMVHWPETMMTLYDDKILFSSDLFGTEVSHENLYALKMKNFSKLTLDYYSIVMRPVYINVGKAIDFVKGLKLDYLLPSHGPIYTKKDYLKIVKYYDKLTNNPEEKKAVIVYSSIWHGTEKIAHLIKKNLKGNVILYNLTESNFVEVMGQCLTASVLIFGSITMNNNYFFLFDSLFNLLKLNHQEGKKVYTFGTYGWVPSGINKMNEKLTEFLEYKVIDSLEVKFKVKDDTVVKKFCKKIKI